MGTNCERPCRELEELQGEFRKFRKETEHRLADGDVTMATINTKLNWLIGILSAIGAAVMTAVLKIISG